jgi:hypothetical protein
MKIEDFSSRTNPFLAPELPDDFARGVIIKARAVQRHRQIAGRIVAGMTVMLLAFAIPLANRISSRNGNFFADHSRASATLASYRQSDDDETDALTLADAVSPDAVGDYLMPNTSALTQFTATYSDASWDYGSDWTASSDASADD